RLGIFSPQSKCMVAASDASWLIKHFGATTVPQQFLRRFGQSSGRKFELARPTLPIPGHGDRFRDHEVWHNRRMSKERPIDPDRSHFARPLSLSALKRECALARGNT